MRSLTPSIPHLSPRQWLTLAIALALLLVLTLLTAPNNPKSDGSTYSRSPEGYSAWYDAVKQAGQPIEQSRQPLNKLFDRKGRKITLLQISPEADRNAIDRDWISQGNRAILIGSRMASRITDAPFNSNIAIPQGQLQIATSRRYHDRNAQSITDQYGAIVQRETIGQGEIIRILPLFLAANAYHDTANNFEFLTNLTKGDRIIVDEYIHGYRDAESAEAEGKGDLFSYFAKTPVAIALIQIMVLLGVLIYGKNWRFGPVRSIQPPVVNNSRAYIQALASVLQKANSTDFVTDTLSQAELQHLQRELGLGTGNLDRHSLLAAWQAETGQSPALLSDLLDSLSEKSPRHKKLTEAELTQWLARLQQLAHVQKT